MQRGLLIAATVGFKTASSALRSTVFRQSPRVFGHRFYQTSARLCLAKMSYTIEERGSANTLEYRLFTRNAEGQVVSPFHDIPLWVNDEKTVCNMVVEVPRWSNAKMEIDVAGKLNPIKQDLKKGKLRFVNNCFPHHGYIWNYGACPQTWEDPTHVDIHTSCKGDNDPIDVCEIGFKVHKRGAVVQVKPLGIMALIDEGETDWKVLAIDVTDPLADKLNDVDDIETHMPGFLKATNEWFRIYKIPTGKPENQFAFKGEARDKEFTLGIIQQTNDQWKALITRQDDSSGLARFNTTLADSPGYTSAEDAETVVSEAPAPGEPAPIDPEVDMWHYVKL